MEERQDSLEMMNSDEKWAFENIAVSLQLYELHIFNAYGSYVLPFSACICFIQFLDNFWFNFCVLFGIAGSNFWIRLEADRCMSCTGRCLDSGPNVHRSAGPLEPLPDFSEDLEVDVIFPQEELHFRQVDQVGQVISEGSGAFGAEVVVLQMKLQGGDLLHFAQRLTQGSATFRAEIVGTQIKHQAGDLLQFDQRLTQGSATFRAEIVGTQIKRQAGDLMQFDQLLTQGSATFRAEIVVAQKKFQAGDLLQFAQRLHGSATFRAEIVERQIKRQAGDLLQFDQLLTQSSGAAEANPLTG